MKEDKEKIRDLLFDYEKEIGDRIRYIIESHKNKDESNELLDYTDRLDKMLQHYLNDKYRDFRKKREIERSLIQNDGTF